MQEAAKECKILAYLLNKNHLIYNEIHSLAWKTKLVFAVFFCYSCRREKEWGTSNQDVFDELSVGKEYEPQGADVFL